METVEISRLSGFTPPLIKQRIRRKLKNLGFRVHTHLGRSTFLFKIYQLLGINQDRVVTPATRLVIEGAARTATTFAYYSFLHAQPEPLRVAYHIHLPAQILKAIELRVPVLVIVRAPREAVASAVVREPYMSTKVYLERYLVLYRALEPLIGKFVVADYREVVCEFPSVIERINTRYDCDFSVPTASAQMDDTVAACLKERDYQFGGGQLQSYLPNKLKQIAKARVNFSRHQRLLDQCEGLYQRYLNRIKDEYGTHPYS